METLEGEEKIPRYNPERDLTVPEAKKIKKDAEVGDIIEIPLETKKDYGRVAAQTARQVIQQRIREAERDTIFTKGPADVLDHATPVMGFGSKMGIDATHKLPGEANTRPWPPIIKLDA